MPLPKNLQILKQFQNDVFVETGTCAGDSIQKVLTLEKFNEIHSVEAIKKSPYHDYEEVVERYKNNPNIHLYFNDSTRFLKEFLSTLEKPATFWLDAHYAGTAPANAYENPVPLLQELYLLKNHSVNTHTIMIDDVRDFRIYGTNKEMVENILREINPDYKIYYVDCSVSKNDVMIASPIDLNL